MAKAEEQRQSAVANLTLERDVAQRVLAGLGAELGKLVAQVGYRDQTLTGQVANLRERILQMERRLNEIREELSMVGSQTVDKNDILATLRQFEPVWESLNSREQVQIVRMLIENIVYNGKTNKVTVSFRSAGIRRMCQGTGSEGANPITPRSG
jgi:site-specific DNA recombinase